MTSKTLNIGDSKRVEFLHRVKVKLLSAQNQLSLTIICLYKPHNSHNEKTYNRYIKDKGNQSLQLWKITNSEREEEKEQRNQNHQFR